MIAQIYNPQSGAILHSFDGPADQLSINVPEGCAYVIGGGRDDTHYVSPEGWLTPKSDYTLGALPLPCTLTIEGVEYLCTEQPTFEFNYPGTYKIQVDAGVRYLKKEFDFDYQP